MSYFIIYLISVAGDLKFVLYLTGVFSMAVGALSACAYYIDKALRAKTFIKFLPIGILLSFLGVLIPNSKALVAMVTVPTVIEYVQSSEEMQKLPDNVVKFVNDYLTKEEDKD